MRTAIGMSLKFPWLHQEKIGMGRSRVARPLAPIISPYCSSRTDLTRLETVFFCAVLGKTAPGAGWSSSPDGSPSTACPWIAWSQTPTSPTSETSASLADFRPFEWTTAAASQLYGATRPQFHAALADP